MTHFKNYSFIRKKMKNTEYLLLLILSFVFINCNNDDFTPLKEQEQRMISYCMLDNRLKEHYIGIQHSYLDSNSIATPQNIRVIFTENYGKTNYMHDTTIPGLQRTIFYYLPGFKLKRDMSYKLTIIKDGLELQAITTVPAATSAVVVMRMDSTVTMNGTTGKFTFKASIPRSSPSLNSIRFYLDYEKYTDGVKKRDTIQIPLYSDDLSRINSFNVDNPDNMSIANFINEPVRPFYAGLVKNWDASYYQLSGYYVDINLPFSHFLYVFNEIGKGAKPENIVIKGGYLVFYSIDKFYYENFIVVKEEAYSIRLDAPYIPTNFSTNYGKPYGFFGAVTADTSKFKIIPYFINRFKYVDGQ
jgi:hypothetical protein